MRIYLVILLSILFVIPLIPSSKNDGLKHKIKPVSQEGIQILSYNMWGLPIWIPKVGINNRFDKACSELLQNEMDIVCLQECFSKRLRKKVLNKMHGHYHFTMDYNCNQKIMLGLTRDCHGGLMTFSKFPILEESFEEYPIWDDMKQTEKIGHKGFLITKIINQSLDTIIVINTHLYAGASNKDEYFRMKQIAFMDSILESRNLYQWKTILSGDLNIDHPEVSEYKQQSRSIVYDYTVNEMNFKDSAPQLHERAYTIDATRNYYSNAKDGRQKLDYVLVRETSDRNSWRVVKAESIYADNNSFSDHLAWQVTYKYEN